MSIDGEICAYVRGCKKKNLAIDMAVTLFGITKEQVITALQSYGLIDENGKYIEPVRLTGKEVTMDKEKRKINYPSFVWSKNRQRKLAELYQQGTEIANIAKHFDVDESLVYQAIDKYDLVRTIKRDAPAPNPANPADVPPTANIELPEPEIHIQLKHLLHFIVDAANHNNDAMAALIDGKENEACFELGQQSAKLSEADKIIKSLLTIFPEP